MKARRGAQYVIPGPPAESPDPAQNMCLSKKKKQLTFKTNPEIREGVHLLIPTFKLSHPSHSILELWH